MVKYAFRTTRFPADIVTYYPGDPVDKFDYSKHGRSPELDLVSLKLRLEIDNDSGNATRLTQALLQPFKVMAFGQMNVKILNGCASLTDWIHTFEKRLSLKTIWANAFAWDVYELIRSRKERADDLVVRGNLEKARIYYSTAREMVKAHPIFCS